MTLLGRKGCRFQGRRQLYRYGCSRVIVEGFAVTWNGGGVVMRSHNRNAVLGE